MIEFNILLAVYYTFFAIIVLLAFAVYFRLRRLASQLAKAETGTSSTSPAHYQSVVSFLLHKSPNFPLSALVKILPGTFVGFGILGTFLGFSNGISGMSLSGNVDELFRKLGIFFSGLNTAFITSIVGVILSVVFGILYQWPLNKIRFHCTRIYAELSKRQNPAETAKNEFDVYIGSLQEMTKTLLAAKETIETTLTTAVGKIEELPQKFLEVGKSLETSIAPVTETFSSMQTTLENYAKQAESLQAASDQIQQTLTKFITTSGDVNVKIRESLEETIGVTKEIQENNVRLTADHRKMLEEYKVIHDSLDGTHSKLKEEVSAYADAIQTHFSLLLASYSEQTQNLLKDQNAQLLEERKAALEDYQKIDENISSILETVNKNLSDYSAAMEKTLVSTLEEYNKTAQKVTESFFGAKIEEEKK